MLVADLINPVMLVVDFADSVHEALWKIFTQSLRISKLEYSLSLTTFALPCYWEESDLANSYRRP